MSYATSSDHEPLVIGDVITKVPIEYLVTASRYQMRNKLNERAIRLYAKQMGCGSPLPPIGVACLEDGNFYVVDGFHRRAALILNDVDIAPRIVIAALSDREAREVARTANLSHGVPLTAREMRNIFRSHMEDGGYVLTQDTEGPSATYQSLRMIASDTLQGRVHYTTVRNWLIEDFPKEYDEMCGLAVEDEPEGGHRSCHDSATSEELKALTGLDILRQFSPYLGELRGNPEALEITKKHLKVLEGSLSLIDFQFGS